MRYIIALLIALAFIGCEEENEYVRKQSIVFNDMQAYIRVGKHFDSGKWSSRNNSFGVVSLIEETPDMQKWTAFDNYPSTPTVYFAVKHDTIVSIWRKP